MLGAILIVIPVLIGLLAFWGNSRGLWSERRLGPSLAHLMHRIRVVPLGCAKNSGQRSLRDAGLPATDAA